MDSERDGAKKPYEPPRVLRLDAAGEAAGACVAGSGDAADCESGIGAAAFCANGDAAGSFCLQGASH